MLYPVFITKKTKAWAIHELSNGIEIYNNYPFIGHDTNKMREELLDIVKKLPLKKETKVKKA